MSSVEEFSNNISQCKYIITEAMHGAIFADSMRIPWFAFSSFTKHHEKSTHYFKWQDWCESMELQFSEIHLPNFWPSDSPLRKWLKRIKITHSLKPINIDHCNLSKPKIFEKKLVDIEHAILNTPIQTCKHNK